MGITSYSCSTRAVRATKDGYATKSLNQIFTQQAKRQVHESMASTGVILREARDSDAHPNTVPIILGLDVTGSMHDIPRQLIADGLPTLMSKLIQNGVPDAALLFVAIGDHECDSHPLQVGQFESGDAELDMWLTRTYLEGGGGGNRGESYPLAWEFASSRVQTDAWDKRKEKGFLITVGDEPFLDSFPKKAFDEIYGDASGHQSTLTAEQLYAAACEKFHVHHINIEHGYRNFTDVKWKDLLGQNLHITKDHTEVPKIIADIVINNLPATRIVTEAHTAATTEESSIVETVEQML